MALWEARSISRTWQTMVSTSQRQLHLYHCVDFFSFFFFLFWVFPFCINVEDQTSQGSGRGSSFLLLRFISELILDSSHATFVLYISHSSIHSFILKYTKACTDE
jgi:hypothetical protein